MPPSHWKRFQLNERPLLNRRDREKVFGCGIHQRAVADPDSLIRECSRAGATRLLVQIPHGDDPPDIWAAYAELLRQISSSGLEVFALDGYPEAIYDPSPLIEKVKRLRSLLVDEQWTGLQLDIEPYLLDRFSDPA